MATYDCLVIGSGCAGLCAARVLAPAHRVLVLEARPRVGGRAQTHVEGDFRVDLGCAQVHGWNEGNPVRGIMDRLNLVSSSSRSVGGMELTLGSEDRRRTLARERRSSSLQRQVSSICSHRCRY